MTDREKLIDVFMHLDEHISYKEEYGVLFDTPFCKAVEDVLKILKNGVTVQQWIPVTERLPEDGGVLATDGKDLYFTNGSWFYKSPTGEIRIPANYGAGANVTHWMPLPEPPKGD